MITSATSRRSTLENLKLRWVVSSDIFVGDFPFIFVVVHFSMIYGEFISWLDCGDYE